MNNFIKKQLIGIAQGMAIFMWLAGILLTSSCNGGHGELAPNFPNNNNVSNIQLPQRLPNNSEASEIIVFCGNPGVGKSSLCNSIFQQFIFKSGVSVGIGVTQQKQEYIYENKKYIDTPGLADIKLRQQAAEEIEKALKENNNYKIVFVATLEAGKIREADLVTINTVCGAIKTPFEYGIVFNKVTKRVIDKIGENGENLRSYLDPLHKQPSSTIVIKKDEDMEDAENAYLSFNSVNRTSLISFISSLNANVILDNQVQAIDVSIYEKRVEEMELKVREMQEALEKARIEKEEDNKRKIAYEVEQKRRDEENRRLFEQQRQENEQQRIYSQNLLAQQKREYEERLKFDKWYYIVSLHNGMVLNIEGASHSLHAKAIMHKKHGGYNQQFKINKNGTIIARHSYKALDCEGGVGLHKNIIQYTPHDGESERFLLDGCTTESYGFIRVGNYCLDIYCSLKTEGTQVISYTPHGGSNQKWKLEEASNI